MKIEVTSDGTTHGTKLVNAETGEEIRVYSPEIEAFIVDGNTINEKDTISGPTVDILRDAVIESKE